MFYHTGCLLLLQSGLHSCCLERLLSEKPLQKLFTAMTLSTPKAKKVSFQRSKYISVLRLPADAVSIISSQQNRNCIQAREHGEEEDK